MRGGASFKPPMAIVMVIVLTIGWLGWMQSDDDPAIVVDAGMSINYFDAGVVAAVTSADVD